MIVALYSTTFTVSEKIMNVKARLLVPFPRGRFQFLPCIVASQSSTRLYEGGGPPATREGDNHVTYTSGSEWPRCKCM